jgi:hypothetical protein
MDAVKAFVNALGQMAATAVQQALGSLNGLKSYLG